jgi:outer membrane protein
LQAFIFTQEVSDLFDGKLHNEFCLYMNNSSRANLSRFLLVSFTSSVAILSLSGQSLSSPVKINSEVLAHSIIDQVLQNTSKISELSKRMTLQDCISEAIKNNPQLIANYNLIQQDEWDLISARRQWMPTLNLNSTIYGFQKSLEKSDINSSGTTSTFLSSGQVFNSYQQSLPSLGITWTFFDPTIVPNINSQLSLLKSQRFTYDYISRGLVLQVQTAYINVQASQELVNAYTDIYRSNKQQVDYLAAQLSKGMIDIGSLEQSKTTMYEQLAILIQYQQALVTEASILAQLLGYSDKTLILASDPLDADSLWRLTLEESIENALSAREEIKSYLQTAESYRWNARELLNSYLPSFYLGYNADLSFESGCLNASSSGSCPRVPSTNKTISQSLNIGITWTFDGGQNAASANSSRATARANENLARNAETQAVQEVKAAYAQYLNYKLAVQLSRKQLASARTTTIASSERFRVGIGDITTVVQSQQLLSSAVQTQVQALQQYNLAIAQLYRYSAILPPMNILLKPRLTSTPVRE